MSSNRLSRSPQLPVPSSPAVISTADVPTITTRLGAQQIVQSLESCERRRHVITSGAIDEIRSESAPSGRVRVARLRREKSQEGSKEQCNSGRPGPAHLVVPKQLNIDVIDHEIQWHTQYEQEDKPTHLVRHVWQRHAEDEGYSDSNSYPCDNSKYG